VDISCVRRGGFRTGLAQARQPARVAHARGALFSALSDDASYYAVADYGLRHGDLPLGGVALLAQPGWAPAIVLLGLLVLASRHPVTDPLGQLNVIGHERCQRSSS
jgi:hypothetical protein